MKILPADLRSGPRHATGAVLVAATCWILGSAALLLAGLLAFSRCRDFVRDARIAASTSNPGYRESGHAGGDGRLPA
jgi:hypothetical protein